MYNQSKGTQPQGVALNVVPNGEKRSQWWWYSVEPNSENLVVRNFLYREFSTSIRTKTKNDNKGTVIYLLHLTPSKNLIQTITLKQSVASNNGVMGQKTLNSCSLYHENLSFLRINCLRYNKLHVFHLDGYSSAVYMHKEEPDQNRTPIPMTMYIIDG